MKTLFVYLPIDILLKITKRLLILLPLLLKIIFLLNLLSIHQVAFGQNLLPLATNEKLDQYNVRQVKVPAGCFLMGSNNAAQLLKKLSAPTWTKSSLGFEDPERTTCITKDYWIDTFEVTNQSFKNFINSNGYRNRALWSDAGLRWLKTQKIDQLPLSCENDIPLKPRVCVTWYEAEAYAHWRGGRLPTEAEWEYAARGPNSFIYPWGNDWDASYANVIDSMGPTQVGSFPNGKSWIGAHDMAGNAMEWVNDWLSKDYPKRKIKNNPAGPLEGTHKIEKGGWWGSNPFVARSSYKHFEDTPDYQDHHIGFRIVVDAD